MTDIKKDSANPKVERKIFIAIIVLLSGAIAVQFITIQIEFEPKEFNDNIGDLAFAVSISLFGLVFVILAQKDLNKYVISAFGTLFAAILPVIATIPIFINPIPHLAGFIVIYIIVVLGWFFGVRHFVIGSIDNEDREKKEFAQSTVKTMFGYLIMIFFGIIGHYVVLMYFFNS